MFRKPIFRYLLAGLLILGLIGAGSAIAYRAGFAQGTGFEGMPFAFDGDNSYEYVDGYGHMDNYRGFGHMPTGRMGHFGGFAFFGLFGMLFHIFLAIMFFKFIFRLLFFPFGMRRRKMMRRHGRMHRMHGHPGMCGWYDEDWDDDEEGDDKEDQSKEESVE